MQPTDFAIVGAGLAGCECALALARAGFSVSLYEQKPLFRSAAHCTDGVAELVCSNSFRSDDPASAIGILHGELRLLGSQIMAAADLCRVPADMALAVDREAFAADVYKRLSHYPQIQLISRRIRAIDEDVLIQNGKHGIVIAAGPLASEDLSSSLAAATGASHCYFYDAIAPIVWTNSLNMAVVFRASRHSASAGDYLNCPLNREEYETFHAALCNGKSFQPREFEQEKHFEGCMPIEALAARGVRTLSYGPLKPVGLIDPRTGKRPHAVLQLRAEKADMETCNLVGCQTRLLQSEQERIFRLVPGLEEAEFCRFGSMHRNTYVDAPYVLAGDLSLRSRPGIYLAGQITGVEGYVESAACGLWLGLSLAAKARGANLAPPPPTTALGALLGHLCAPAKDFQPSNVNFGLMPALTEKVRKRERKQLYACRAQTDFVNWLDETGFSQRG